ncbi:MAG: hypothetical protein IJ689_00925 [Alphaproteobacteria bacterium]|nr:hypothetical protein [Alphaproteobacteria bacterium]
MTNKTFLILLLLGVSYTAYNVSAVSENFAISTTIDHEIVLSNFKTASADANLDVTGNISLGTIYINPNGTEESWWSYDDAGQVAGLNGDIVVKADNINFGTFSANVSNPQACNGKSTSCAGLSTRRHVVMFGATYWYDSYCNFYIKYSGSGNVFKVFPHCIIYHVSSVSRGYHSQTFDISYTAE